MPSSFQVAEIHAQSSRLEVTNSHLTSDLGVCEQSKKEAAADAEKQRQEKQTIHDNQVDVGGRRSPAVAPLFLG